MKARTLLYYTLHTDYHAPPPPPHVRTCSLAHSLFFALLNMRTPALCTRRCTAQINASTTEDVFFAQGLVVANLRLWQLEFQRRVGAGRLSEAVGSGGNMMMHINIMCVMVWQPPQLLRSATNGLCPVVGVFCFILDFATKGIARSAHVANL